MKMHKKLLLKKVSIASMNHLQAIKGGGTLLCNTVNICETLDKCETLDDDECLSFHTAIETTCATTADIQCKTGTSRGNTSII